MDKRGVATDMGRVEASASSKAPVLDERLRPPALGNLLIRVGRAAAHTVLAGTLLVDAFTKADVGNAEAIWPVNKTEIVEVEGAELPTNSEEVGDTKLVLVFGGFGQVRPKPAAEQVAAAKEAAGEDVAVAYVVYKNQGLHENDELGRADYEVLEEFIDESGVKRIAIVGISMGLPIGLDWFSSIVADAEAEGKKIDWRIEEVIGYSSPFDGRDPWRSDLLDAVADTEYPGGLYTKFLYNLDWGRVFDPTLNPHERASSLAGTIEKTFNECSPRLATSQAKWLANADPSRWIPLFQKYADGVVFVYMIGELPDNVLNADQAANKYFDFIGKIGNATLQLIIVAGAGHANTFLSANTLSEVLQADQASDEPVLAQDLPTDA